MCLAGWMTVGVGVGYQDLANVYEELTGARPGKWVRPPEDPPAMMEDPSSSP